jgi:PAS domain S-box-containing protein
MKLKNIFFYFTILTLITSALGLYFYYNAQKTAAYNEDRLISISHTNSIKHSFSEMISRYQRITLSLSRHPALSLLLKQYSLENLNKANNILDIYNSSMQTSACYLMDMNGITIASSNRNDLSSFVGKNYSFRSYFKNAVQGNPFIYMALGITSGERGIYFSNPVFDEERALTGVVVIKEDVKTIEEDIFDKHAPTHAENKNFVFITDENGVVFISDHPDKILHTLWEIDKKSLDRINASKQFGKGPWPWVGFKKTGQKKISDKSGKKYDLIVTDVKEPYGWKIVHLSDTEAISGRVFSSLLNAAGYILLFLFILLISVLFILNFQATKTGKTLQRRIEYEKVLATISSNLAGIGIDSIDTAIDNSLSLIGNFTKADRTYIFQFNKNADTMDNTHEWCAVGVEPQIQNLKDIPVEKKLPWFMAQIKNNEIVNVPDVTGLPKKAQLEKQHFVDQGIQSLIVLPIEKSENLMGFIGFDAVGKCRKWKNNDVSLLKFFCQALGHVLDRKKAEEALENKNYYLETSQALGQIGTWELDLINNTLFWTDENCRIFGVPEGSVVDHEIFLSKVHPDDREYVNREWKAAVEGNPYDIEHRLLLDGEVKWIREKANFEFDDNGKAVSAIGFTQDITERNQAKEKLKAEHDLMQNIMEISPAGITHVNREGKIVYANQRAQEILGIRSDETGIIKFDDPKWEITDFFGNPILPEKLPFCIVKKTGKSVYGIQHTIESPNNGRRTLLSINSSPLMNDKGKFSGMVSSLEDITEKHKTEKKYKMLFDEMIDGFALHEIICDDSGKPVNYRFLEINPAFERMTGLKSESLIGRMVLDVIPKTEPLWIEKYGKVALTGKPDTFESYSQELDRYFHVTAFRYTENQFACIFVDVTKNKLAEAERSRLVEAINQAGESIVITDRDGNIQYTNPTFEKTTGYSSEEAFNKNPRFLKSGLQNTSIYKGLWDTILSGNRWTGELVNKRKTGELYTSECSISPIKDENGQITNFIWIAKDITKQKDLEKRINQAQKIESIGSLAGGIAHDFNNILFPIVGMSELLMEDLSPDSIEYENAQEIYKAGKRAKDLVNQILSFSRQAEHEMMPVKFQKILKEVLKLCRSTIPANIEIKQEIQSDCGSIWANATQLHQIGMNLITNAYHAVQDKNGKIIIELKEIIIESDEMDSISVGPGEYALLSVTDNGTGMSDEIKSKIFDPYFTTKPKGKGTGLGLAVVYGIVKKSGGDIKIYTEVGFGTTFSVYLPLIKKTPDPKSSDFKIDIQTGHEHILLVDDEPAIARLVQLILERLGYTVTVRLNSIEALEAFKEKFEKFDLVISDMSMPHMTGDQLAREIKKISPDMPIIICTGFSERINKAEDIGVSGFLMKPVVKSDMATMIRKVLDEAITR